MLHQLGRRHSPLQIRLEWFLRLATATLGVEQMVTTGAGERRFNRLDQ